MLIENEFTVDAAPEAVFDLMVDVERVAPCLPGTEILGAREDGGYDGQMSVKLGPMKMKYKGTVVISEQDRAERTAVMIAKGIEAKGQGSAQGTMTMAVHEDPAGARVRVSTDIKITGRVAQMGQGIMKDVSTRMVGEMARNMEQALSVGNGPAEGRLSGTTEASRGSAAIEEPDSVSAEADRGASEPVTDAATTTAPAGAARPAVSHAQSSHTAAPAAVPRSTPARSADVKLMTIIRAVVIGRLHALRTFLRAQRGS